MRHGKSKNQWLILSLIGLSLLLSTFLIYYAEAEHLEFLSVYRYFYLIPITLAAYHFGKAMGLSISLFCSALFIPLLAKHIAWSGLSGHTIEILGLLPLYNIYAFFVADITASLRYGEELSRSLNRLERLLDKALSLQEVVSLILDHAIEVCNAEWGEMALVKEPDGELVLLLNTRLQGRAPGVADGAPKNAKALPRWVIEQNRPLILHELNDDPRFIEVPSSPNVPINSAIVAPVRKGDMVTGYVALFKGEGEFFTEKDMASLEAVISRSEMTIWNAITYTKTERALARRVDELSTMAEIATRLNSTLNLAEITEFILDKAIEMTLAEAGMVVLCDGRTGGLSPLASHGACFGLLEDVSRVLFDELISRSAQVEGDSWGPLFLGNSSRLAVPILKEDDAIGAILLASPSSNAFSEEDIRFLVNLATHAAIAIENARLFQTVSRERLMMELVLRGIADGVYTTDKERRILTFNPAAERLSGRSREEVIGKTCAEVFGLVDEEGAKICERDCALIKALEGGLSDVPYHCEGNLQKGWKKRSYISISIAPLLDAWGNVTGTVATFRDMTKEKELDRMKSEFISMVSHQLRAPLSNIRASIELLRDSLPAEAADRELLDIAYSQSIGLSNFVEQILDLTRLEEGQIHLESQPVALRPIIRQVMEPFAARSKLHRFETRLPEPSPLILVDERSLEIILSNLLENAVNYSPEGGKITIAARNKGQDVVISVSDEGIGIPPEDLERVFDRFYRVNGSDAQRIYGHGLGLYIAKKLVELQGGKIWAKSRPGAGSCFYFSLPRVEVRYEGKENIDN